MRIGIAGIVIAALVSSAQVAQAACTPSESRTVYYQVRELACRVEYPKTQKVVLIRLPERNAMVVLIEQQAKLIVHGSLKDEGTLEVHGWCSEGPVYVQWKQEPYMAAYGRALQGSAAKRDPECMVTTILSSTP